MKKRDVIQLLQSILRAQTGVRLACYAGNIQLPTTRDGTALSAMGLIFGPFGIIVYRTTCYAVVHRNTGAHAGSYRDLWEAIYAVGALTMFPVDWPTLTVEQFAALQQDSAYQEHIRRSKQAGTWLRASQQGQEQAARAQP